MVGLEAVLFNYPAWRLLRFLLISSHSCAPAPAIMPRLRSENKLDKGDLEKDTAELQSLSPVKESFVVKSDGHTELISHRHYFTASIHDSQWSSSN